MQGLTPVFFAGGKKNIHEAVSIIVFSVCGSEGKKGGVMATKGLYKEAKGRKIGLLY